MSTRKNKELVRKHFEEVYNEGNLEFADECCLPSFVLHDPMIPDLPGGPAAVKELARFYGDAFPDLRFTLHEVIGEDEFVMARWTASGTHRGKFLGIAPTEKYASVNGLTLYRFKDDLMMEAWVQWDVLAMLKAMNVKLPLEMKAPVIA